MTQKKWININDLKFVAKETNVTLNTDNRNFKIFMNIKGLVLESHRQKEFLQYIKINKRSDYFSNYTDIEDFETNFSSIEGPFENAVTLQNIITRW